MSTSDREIKLNLMLAEVEHKFKDLPIDQLDSEATGLLGKAAITNRFHWPLEFPEVFERGGFDAFVCNPPFMGGLKLESHFGSTYRAYIVSYLAKGITGVRGTADLCAYFLLQAASLLNSSGGFGMLATNTIGQGDAKTVGLEQLTAKGCTIHKAVPSRKWPGDASIEIAQVWITRRQWNSSAELDHQVVERISASLLVAEEGESNPHPLMANHDKAFQGANVLGLGFLLSDAEAQQIIAKDARYSDVLRPYLNGQELNSLFNEKPVRWVINFQDWPLDRKSASVGYKGPTASDYAACLGIIEDKVKPERLSLPPKNAMNIRAKELWWQFRELRKQLLAVIKDRETVLVRARIANLHSVIRLPASWIFNEKTVVFVDCPFAVLQSTFHETWARKYSSTLRTDMQYTPTMCFETFPFPSHSAKADSIGNKYHSVRSEIMLKHKEGLTKTYNRFHNSKRPGADIQQLRDLHVEMDQSVAAAYGWDDLDLGHGFHETKQGVRYTISETARREVLQRLLKLNHDRYAEEVKQGLHGKTKPAAGKAAKKGRKAAAAPGPGLFDREVVDPAFPSTPRERLMCAAMLNLVRSSPGLPTPDYLDALLLATHPNDCQPLLTGSDQTSFQRATKKVPKDLIDDTNEVPWREIRQSLLGNKSLREVNAEGTTQLMPGEKLEAVSATFPAIETAYLQLVGKAAERLREIISTVQPSGSKEAGIVRRFNEIREATMKS